MMPMVRTLVRRLRGDARGQGLLEFSLVLPLFLSLIFGIVDVGRVIWAQDSLAHAAREAARYASVHGGWPLTSCPTGPNLGITPATGCPTWTPDSKEPTRIQARGFATAAGASVTVTVCYFTTTPCSGDTDEANASNGRGEYVTVGVTSQVNLVTGSFLHLGNYTVSSTSTVIVNN